MVDDKGKKNVDLNKDYPTELNLEDNPLLKSQNITRNDITMGGPYAVIDQEDIEFLEDVRQVKKQNKRNSPHIQKDPTQ